MDQTDDEYVVEPLLSRLDMDVDYLERFSTFRVLIENTLRSRLGANSKVELIGEMVWFEIGMLYEELRLFEKDDEDAASDLAHHIIQKGYYTKG